MPHDCDGNRIKVGDIVLIEAKIKEIHDTEDYCNVNLETSLGMPPHERATPIILNARQVRKKTLNG